MKKKHYHILNACLYGTGAVFFLSLPLWTEIGDAGLGNSLGFLIAAIFAYLSFRNFKLIKENLEEEQVYRPNTDDSIGQQIVFYKTYTYISAIGFPILSFIIFIDLHDLVSGNVQQIRLLEPVAFLYKQFGYWPAVLSIPVAGIIITFLGVRKIITLKSIHKKK
jgi:hypothetical protein